MRLSVLLASAFASPVFAATRSVTVVVPPPSALATFARVSPGRDVVVALLALPLTLALFFGSQERTLTVSTCWMPLMRGRNDCRFSCHLTVVGDPAALFAGRNVSL